MQYKESEFYTKLLELIDRDLSKKSLKPIDLLRIDYVISRTQYYNMKKVSQGDKKISRLSHSRLVGLCKHLGVDLKEILFDINTESTL